MDRALAGLQRLPRELPAELLYDNKGIQLFEKVKQSKGYASASVETALIRDRASDIAASTGMPHGGTLVDYGAVSLGKTEPLLDILKPANYVAVDTSESALQKVEYDLKQAGWLELGRFIPVTANFLQPATLPDEVRRTFIVGVFAGLTVCNFAAIEVQKILGHMRQTLGTGAHLLLGVDTVRNSGRLRDAYADADGINAAFVLNVLNHLNRDGPGNFATEDFRHHMRWNQEAGRVEVYIASRKMQRVSFRGHTLDFSTDEKIHVIDSYKYTVGEFKRLAETRTGWMQLQAWCDQDNLAALHLLKS